MNGGCVMSDGLGRDCGNTTYAALRMGEVFADCLLSAPIDEKKEPWREIDPDEEVMEMGDKKKGKGKAKGKPKATKKPY